jgi:hypothetical protein
MRARKLHQPKHMPKTVHDYFPLEGGLDLMTPAIAMKPGKVISSQNYEPNIGGGYRRIDGFERYDGQASPSSKGYWIATVTLTSGVSVNDTITGLSSGVTGVVLYQTTGILVLGAVSGNFTNGESISNGATVGTIGTVTSMGATSSSDHADYTNLAADLQRTLIQKVPGSGPIRGVWFYNNVLYAFRDNVGATAGNMYKATSSGWVQVTFGTELQFSSTMGGATPIAAGQTIGNLGAGPTKTATVVAVLTRKGTWGTDAVGTLIITPVTGVWANAEAIFVGATQKAVSTTAATSIARLPGGSMEFVNSNFTGSTATKKMYGADGVNLGFEFDGTNYIPIRTGMTTDTPSHVVAHKYYLFYSFLGSVQISGLGTPYAWTAVLGAAEISTGDPVSAFNVQQGQATSGASLAIFTEGTTFILYGSSSANFVLTPSFDDIGSFAYTAQSVGNDSMILTNRGIQRLKTTLNYGNFEYASVSHLIQPLITTKRGLQTASTTLKAKNQYRVYFSDNSAIAIGMTGDKITGIMPLDYGIPVRCMCTAEDSTGKERAWFGSDDGYIYEDNVGTSQDGNPITSWIRLPFNNEKSPRTRKRFRAAILELISEGFASINVTYDLGYGSPDVADGVAVIGQSLLTAGGYWDQFTWENFTWDTQTIGNPRISLDGSHTNISLLFYSSRDQDSSHTLQGITLATTPQRIER